MDEIYNWGYYISESYNDPEHWVKFFGGVAKHIAEELNPKTVLDVGCSVGYLVAALRDEGIEAYGTDVSADAIAHAREDIRPYLQVNSLLEEAMPSGFPARFDLVTNVEVLEHLYEEELEAALKKLCSFSDHILFSSSPDDIVEETHVNVRQPEYWVKMFAAQGFYRSMSYDGSYLSRDTLFFTRHNEMSLPRLAEDYEHYLRLVKLHAYEALQRSGRIAYTPVLRFGSGQNIQGAALVINHDQPDFSWEAQLPPGSSTIQFIAANGARCVAEGLSITVAGQGLPLTDMRGKAVGQNQLLLELGEPIYAHREESSTESLPLRVSGRIYPITQDAFITAFTGQQRAMQRQKAEWEKEAELAEERYKAMEEDRDRFKDTYQNIVQSSSWRLTRPLRGLTRGGKGAVRGLCLRLPGLRSFYPWASSVRHLGRAQVKFNSQRYGSYDGPPSPLIPGYEELLAQAASASPAVKFSIIVPLYNTPAAYLEALLRSVVYQSYPNWELCLADGSDDGNGHIAALVAKYTRKDSRGRIHYKKLPGNLGIAGNSNAAIEMAGGDYLALLDHDDILNLSALYEMSLAIAQSGAEFLYSDEMTFRGSNLRDVQIVNLKPDFSPDTLRSLNYICHFSVFKASLLERAGGPFREAYNGSQDYDLFLRLTEVANQVLHLPKVLYFWRSHENSVASSAGAKPYVLDAAKRAIAAQLERLCLSGEVEDNPKLITTYHVKYDIIGQPLISILIPNKDEAATLRCCIQSIREKSTYQNFEIIICENNSAEEDTFVCYKELEEDPRIRVVTWEGVFNYSAINNYAASFAKGEYLLLLNNDTEVISENWLEEMLMFAQRSDVGAVGAKLYYPDDSLQHGGVVVGLGGVAAHIHVTLPRDFAGFMGILTYARNVSCVTAACLMIRKAVYDEVEGLNEKFTVAFNDVDFCMRLRKAGYLVVMTPFAELYHYESKSRGDDQSPAKLARFQGEVQRFQSLWSRELEMGDPYYNKNLSVNTTNYDLDISL